eukprot:SAG11_NODE_282_length_11247_cov_11.050323_13_plen_51_part_00
MSTYNTASAGASAVARLGGADAGVTSARVLVPSAFRLVARPSNLKVMAIY